MKKILSVLTIQMLFFSSFAQVRPNINSFTSAQQTQLANLMMVYITPAVIEDHCNYDPMNMMIPHIHSEFDFLPFHRIYIEKMEDFLIRQGFPQFVPLPYWDPSGTVPLPLRVIDTDCSSATCNNGDGPCSFSVNWTPNRVLPTNLRLPIIAGANNDLCDWICIIQRHQLQ